MCRLKIYATIDLHAKGNIHVVLNVFSSLIKYFGDFFGFQAIEVISVVICEMQLPWPKRHLYLPIPLGWHVQQLMISVLCINSINIYFSF